MYPRPFRYVQPSGLREALAALADLGGDARILAGGASLVPLMKYRAVTPSVLVDIGRLDELSSCRDDNGRMTLGATVRHGDVVESPAATRFPLLAEVASGIGDPQVRNMGTVGGGIAAVEPTGDWGPTLLATRGSVTACRRDGERLVAADELFVDAYTTSLSQDEIITEVHFPAPGKDAGSGQSKLELRAGAAVGSAVVVLDFDGDEIATAGVALGAIERRPIRVRAAEEILEGGPIERERLERAVAATRADVSPYADVRGVADYRRHLAGTLVERAAVHAAQRAGRNPYSSTQTHVTSRGDSL